MKIRGVLLACSAGALWALSGIMCQILFEEYLVSPEWLASVRLLTAGVLLTGLNLFQRKGTAAKIFSVRFFQSAAVFSDWHAGGAVYLFQSDPI